jgi:trigger factor
MRTSPGFGEVIFSRPVARERDRRRSKESSAVSSPAKPELEVEVEVKELEGGQVELQVRVPPEPVTKVREQVLKAFARGANVPGFRKGKAPRAIIERMVDKDALKEQIVDTLMENAYDAAIEKAEIEPMDRAQLGEAELGEDGGMTFSATMTRRPGIELGEYKGLQATRRVTKVTDEQVEAELNRVRERRASFAELAEGGEIEKGDLVVVDYDMIVDGVKKEDSSAAGYPLEVGADQLFPEMNEALLGAKVTDTREFEVTYPEDHSDESVQGKTATFKATVKEARRRQLPELDDEFAKAVSDLETMEALRQRVRDNLEAMSTAMADDDVRQQLIRQVSDEAKLDVPQSVVGREVDRRIEEVEQELDRRGLTLPQYLQNLGRSFEDWRADMESDARAAARRALVLDQIGDREDTKVTEEEVHEEMHRMAEAEEIKEDEVRERLSESGQLNRLVTRLYHRKIVQFLMDNAEITEEEVEPEVESAEAGPAAEEPAAQPAEEQKEE